MLDLIERESVERDYSTASDEEVYAGALEWLNLLRAEYNQEPLDEIPPGVPSHPGKCALAQALAGVHDGSCQPPPASRYRPGPSMASFSREGRIMDHPIPPLANEFMRRFDAGHFPNLLAPIGFAPLSELLVP